MLPIKLEPRGESARTVAYFTPLLAVILTMIGGFVLFALMGQDPLEALYVFFISPLTSYYGFSELLLKATPLGLIAVGLSIGFRANVWNIGAEGQLTLGAIFGGGMALAFYEMDGFWILPVMLIAGVLGGMVWAAIPAFLKTRFNTNEILTSLMLTYVATLLLSFLVHGPWRDPDGFNFPESRLFWDSALLPALLEGTRLHVGSLLVPLVVAVAWVFLNRSFVGFQIKVMGLTPAAAGYAGFNQKRLTWLALMIGGGLAGLAGVLEVAGPIGQLNPTISPGYGFTAIIVAFLGRLHPVGIFFAALLMALSYLGGEAMQIQMGLPLAVTGVFQGMILFFLLASDVLIRYRLRFTMNSAKAGQESV
ncbi:ABC transporter permease [Kiloniella sp. b19]|uniref:ABC transporter permease n=1 Tax=Kiloniella sp. GXU_MW_B19 TaxID=3141326 RepID=UPI0031D4482C